MESRKNKHDFDINSPTRGKNIKALSNMKSIMTVFTEYLPNGYDNLPAAQKDALYDQMFVKFASK